MKIAYVTTYDAADIQHFSGIATYMARALEGPNTDLAYVGPLHERMVLPFKVRQQFYRSLLRQDHHRNREPFILRGYARQVAPRLAALRPDVVFSPSTLPLAFVETNRPLVFWTDATFAGLVDFYPEFKKLSQATLRNGHRAEQAALDRCSLAIYSSEWAARSAIRDYGADPAKVRVVPFGANLDDAPPLEAVETFIAERPPDRCRLLFLSKYWERKGGDLAFAAAHALNRAGLPVELTVIGCDPPLPTPLPRFVHALGFADKKTEAGRKTLRRALAEAHFLILPTQADCTPIVLNEANAFGVPCLTTDVGGIPTIIRTGRNGATFAPDAAGEAYAAWIVNLFSDYRNYQRLARASWAEYHARLNWTAAGRTVRRLLQGLRGGRAA